MENHTELQEIFEEYKHSERLRQHEELIHSELVNILHQKSKLIEVISPQSPSKSKLSSSGCGNKVNPSSISASETEIGDSKPKIASLSFKDRLDLYREYTESSKINRINIDRKNFVN
ncbi:hypothetical protein HHI36_020955 [Cryptolaemus montrouzieri]|uniref:Uncharacterized protein n=1 Tax=Cryptolaemus montrouzieri TaxID=559131 RepID=A0ABD2NBX3_9CUCU